MLWDLQVLERKVSYTCDRSYSLPLRDQTPFKARFVSRPNRFLMLCDTEEQGRITAFLPNPGRLSELLFPGCSVYLLHEPDPNHERATDHTVLAVVRDGAPVMVHTHWCNFMARKFFEDRLVPGFEKARLVRQEIRVGRNRFDFLLEDAQGKWYVEVKSCTLFGQGVAMFPDAVTARGRRHLQELSVIAQSDNNIRCAVLFLVQTDRTCCFMPDYHTDLAFSNTMLAVRERVAIAALPVSWDASLCFRPCRALLPIPWDHIALEAQDRGAYVLILSLDHPQRIAVGSLGETDFQEGYYLYIGSAMKGLTARLARHQRKRKRMHWHIDYLRDKAMLVEALPIRSSLRMECSIAKDMYALPASPIPGFGCGDCACDTHLFYMSHSPMNIPAFHALIQRYRMVPPESL